jgi:hypothetical protein
MTSMADAALAYAKRGWPVFPCKADKSPHTTHGFLEATTDTKQIKAWWAEWPKANIGFEPASMSWMVIDLDPGHSMKELEDNVGELPATLLSARTPRGGSHLYYRLAEGERVAPSASKLAQHVDVRSFHSYVLLAPSKTSDGVYTWESEGKPAYRTDELVRVASSARDKHEDRDTWIIEPDLEENVDLASKWLREDAKIGIKGDGGNHVTYSTAAMMKSYGLSEGTAFEVMWEHWCPRCSPPWDGGSADELERTISNAYSYNTSPPGNCTPSYTVASKAALFSAVVTLKDKDGSAHEWTAGRFRAVDREGMLSIQPPEWLIEDLLPADAYAILFGASGTFKTFVALDIAMSVVSCFVMGENANWPVAAKSGKVLFAAGEGRPNINKRIRAWEQTHAEGNQTDGLILIDPVPMISEGIEPFIEAALAASPEGYALTILDTVGRSMQGVNENAQENASAFTGLVQQIQYDLGGAVLGLHHTGHSASDRARGSSVFGADADTMLRIDRPGKSYTVAMHMTKQKDGVEWANPRYVKLNEVSVSMDEQTLVAVKSDVNQMEEEKPEPKAKKSKMSEVTLAKLHVAELALLAHFEATKGPLHLSDKGMAEAIAQSEHVEVGIDQVRRGYIQHLKVAPATFAYYDVNAKAADKWRHPREAKE